MRSIVVISFLLVVIALHVQLSCADSVCSKIDPLSRQLLAITCPQLFQSHKYKYCCGTAENRYCCKESEFRRYIGPEYQTTYYRSYGRMGGFFTFLFCVSVIACCCGLANRLKRRQQAGQPFAVTTSSVGNPAVHVMNQPPPTSYPQQPIPPPGSYPINTGFYPKAPEFGAYPMPPPPAYTPTPEYTQQAAPPPNPSYPSYPTYPTAPAKQ